MRFNSSFLGHYDFKHDMEQKVGEFTRQVIVHGVSSCNICLSKIQFFTCYYGIYQASIYKQKIILIQQFLDINYFFLNFFLSSSSSSSSVCECVCVKMWCHVCMILLSLVDGWAQVQVLAMEGCCFIYNINNG